jgi:peptidoglycan hydrolase CwlO-like protein
MNKVVEYLKRAFEGRNLEADAEKLGMTLENLNALIENGGLISAKFAKELEEKINSIRAKELLDAQLAQAKEEAKAVNPDAAVKEARVEKPAAETPAPKRQGRAGQSCAQPMFGQQQRRQGNLMV